MTDMASTSGSSGGGNPDRPDIQANNTKCVSVSSPKWSGTLAMNLVDFPNLITTMPSRNLPTLSPYASQSSRNLQLDQLAPTRGISSGPLTIKNPASGESITWMLEMGKLVQNIITEAGLEVHTYLEIWLLLERSTLPFNKKYTVRTVLNYDKNVARENTFTDIISGGQQFKRVFLLRLDRLEEHIKVQPDSDVVPISLEVTIFSSFVVSPSKPLTLQDKIAHQVDERDRWIERALEEGVASDVTIKCHDTEFKVHRLFLSRSPVFTRMLETPMKESESKIIELNDVTPDIVKLMLKFLYLGKVELPTDEDQLFAILDCTEKYDIEDLKTRCFQDMTENLSHKNAGKFTVMASLYSHDEELKSYFRDYCLRHHKTLAKDQEYKKIFIQNWDAFH